MAGATGAIAVAKLCIKGRYAVHRICYVSDWFTLARRIEAIATLGESASHGPMQAHHLYDGGFVFKYVAS